MRQITIEIQASKSHDEVEQKLIAVILNIENPINRISDSKDEGI